MKNVRHLFKLLALASCLMVSAVYGDVFNFRYTFDSGVVASGSLSGTQAGQFITGVSNVSLFFNGVPVAGSIFATKYDSAFANPYVSGPIVSFNALQNNFVFTNSNLTAGDFLFDSQFSMINKTASPPFDTAVGISPVSFSQDLPTIASRWSLTPAAVGVPDESMTIVLLGMGMAGLMWSRRRR